MNSINPPSQNLSLLMHLEERVPSNIKFIIKITLLVAILYPLDMYFSAQGMTIASICTIAAFMAGIAYLYFDTYTQAADQAWLNKLKGLSCDSAVESYFVSEIVRGRGEPGVVLTSYNGLLDFYAMREDAFFEMQSQAACNA